MKNKRLIEIIKDPGIATEKEIKVIKTLSSDYSYSPFLKVLQARIDNLHNRKSKSKSLSRAAIYIADRSVLKDFISNDRPIVRLPGTEPSLAREKDKIKSGKQISTQTEKPTRAVEEEVKTATIEIQQEEIIAEEKDPFGKEESTKEMAEGKTSTIAKELDKVMEEKPAGEFILDENGSAAGTEAEEDITEAKEEDNVPKVVDIKDKLEEILHEDPKEKKSKKGEVTDGESKRSAADENYRADAVVEDKSKTSEMPKAGEDALSSEIMKNISELKKHRASLFRMLELESLEKGEHNKGKDSKSSHKKKVKKEKQHKKSKESQDSIEESDTANDHADDIVDDERAQNYPNYEEEDPKVIKDFLSKLEKENPPPKRKLKKEEQEALIEKFIKSDPTMKNVRSSKEIPDKKDLSQASVKFRDDIISENLANIMIKQGKHDKAIDIYKKLIWKFPQKKTYFAAQIEELKKKSGN